MSRPVARGWGSKQWNKKTGFRSPGQAVPQTKVCETPAGDLIPGAETPPLVPLNTTASASLKTSIIPIACEIG